MKKSFLLASLLAIRLASATLYAQTWSPDMATISNLEATIHSGDYPKAGSKVHDLSDYARYYAGYTEGGHRMIAGEFVTHQFANQKPAGIYIVANRQKFPVIFDGGCGIVNIVYDADASKVLSFRCNGVA